MITVVKIVLLNDKNQALLNLRSKDAKEYPNTWSFFGGGVEKGETPEEGLIREVKEEINFDLKEYKKIYEINADNKKNIYYAGKCNGPLSSLSLGEGDDFGFFSYEETKKLFMRELNRKVLAMVFK